MLASMQETYLYHENHGIDLPMVGLIFAMVGQQFWTSLCIEIVSTDLLSCFFLLFFIIYLTVKWFLTYFE